MNVSFNHLRSDKIVFWGFIGALGFLVVTTTYIVVLYNSLPPVIPLYNQMPWGIQRLGTRNEIFIPVAFAGGIYIINLFFSSAIYTRMPLISRILCTTSLLICLFMLLFIIRTIQVIL